MSVYSSAYYQKNREKYLARARALYEADPETARRRNLARYHSDPERHLERMKERKYGLAPGELTARYEAQGGLCRICAGPFPKLTRKGLHVDHDHKTGRVRGLICSDCNTILGRAKDRVDVLERAIAYLKSPS